jgi:hypothetical protein
MKKMATYILISSILPLIFFINVSIPVYVLGCQTRGIIAAVIALISVCLALFAAIKGLLTKLESIPESKIWMLNCFILALPAVYIVFTV